MGGMAALWLDTVQHELMLLLHAWGPYTSPVGSYVSCLCYRHCSLHRLPRLLTLLLLSDTSMPKVPRYWIRLGSSKYRRYFCLTPRVSTLFCVAPWNSQRNSQTHPCAGRSVVFFLSLLSFSTVLTRSNHGVWVELGPAADESRTRRKFESRVIAPESLGSRV
jgi:hypothetical protein